MVDHQNYLQNEGDGYSNHPKPNPVNSTLYRLDLVRCCSFFFTLATLSILIVFLLLIYFPIHCQEPHLPKVELRSSPRVAVLNISDHQLTANWDIVFWFRNPNKISVSFDNVNVLAFDGHHKPISNTTISPFILASKEEIQDVHATFEEVTMVVDGWNSYDSSGHGASGVTTLNTTITIARYKTRKWFSKTWVEAKCNNLKVLFSSNSNMTTILGSDACAVNKKLLGIQNIWKILVEYWVIWVFAPPAFVFGGSSILYQLYAYYHNVPIGYRGERWLDQGAASRLGLEGRASLSDREAGLDEHGKVRRDSLSLSTC